MTTLRWQVKPQPGYGDIISPLAYVARPETPATHVEFYCPKGPSFKCHPDDEETFEERVAWLADMTRPHPSWGVSWYSSLPRQIDHVNFDETDQPNHACASRLWSVNHLSDHAPQAVCLPRGDGWKTGEMPDHITDDYDVVHVGYQDPVAEAVSKLMCSYQFTGYHGSVAWLARWLEMPMVLYTSRPEWTRTVFPTAEIRGLQTKGIATG